MPTVRTAFRNEMHELEQEILKMGAFVEAMFTDAVRALTEQDVPLAEEVIRRDDVADDLDVEIESRCMRLLALQQPMARDLRVIGTGLKVISDLERIGDYAVVIARGARVLAREPSIRPLVDIPRMADAARKMLRDALTAFVNRDLELVRRVCDNDKAIDELWHALMGELMELMRQDADLVTQATHFLLIARCLERIADHAVNVAERVAYMETGILQQLAPSHKAE